MMPEIQAHKSVLVHEVLSYLEPKPQEIYVDVTFGSGGHTRAILEAESRCTVIGMDWDKKSLDQYSPPLSEQFGDRFIPLWGNFAHILKLLRKLKVSQVHGVVADFGTSHMQLAARAGFSFYRDTPLDMRMSPAHYKTTAADVINMSSEEKLSRIFYELGEERFAKKVAHAIVVERARKEFKTTKQLAELMVRLIPYRPGVVIHPATKIFQALRIYVNHELENIHAFLAGTLPVLADGGRLICISFHSLEDRLVKQFFRDQEYMHMLKIITKQPIVPSKEEVSHNPSARSAKLRVAIRTRQ